MTTDLYHLSASTKRLLLTKDASLQANTFGVFILILVCTGVSVFSFATLDCVSSQTELSSLS